jgi:hypothetical protein
LVPRMSEKSPNAQQPRRPARVCGCAHAIDPVIPLARRDDGPEPTTGRGSTLSSRSFAESPSVCWSLLGAR